MRNRILPALVGAAVLAGWVGLAQMHKVAKPEQVVRAVGVYEWTGDLSKPKASRFVPVSLFIEGEFQDAGVYIARPVPFALQTGNIYELDDAGQLKGTVELSYARHVQATDSQGDSLFEDGWLGYGDFHPPPLTASVARLRQSKTLPVITTSGGDSGKPHLSDKTSSGSSTSAGSDDPDQPTMHRRDSGNGGGASNGSGSGSAGSAPADDPDRPTMKRKTDSDTTTASSGGNSGGGGSSDDDPDRPTLKRRSPDEMKKEAKQKDMASVMGTGKSLNDDPDRPTLHHKAPTEERSLSELRGIPTDMHQMVAVSDAKSREPHIFARPWEDDTERAMVLAKMQALARAQLAAYKTPLTPAVSVASAGSAGTGSSASTAAAQPTESASAAMAKAEQDPGAPTLKRGIPQQQKAPAAAATPAKTAPATTVKTTTTASHATGTRRVAKSAAPAPVALLDEELRGFVLSYGGAPTFVYTAHTDGTGSALRYVTIIAQDNGVNTSGSGGLGELKLALASVTDEGHLDRTPRLRLIDAVDAEASNRASLLFEMRATRSRQFALYRVIAAKPEQVFVTGTTE